MRLKKATALYEKVRFLVIGLSFKRNVSEAECQMLTPLSSISIITALGTSCNVGFKKKNSKYLGDFQLKIVFLVFNGMS